MQVGKLRNKVEIWGKTKVLNELNQTTYRDGKIASVYAEIVPQTGKLQKQEAESILTNVTHKLIIRYRKDLKPDMHIRFKGKRFNIRYILNPYFRNESLEVFVEEVFT
ncbi:phage head closure protein [Paenibacillus sp. NPDC093718]|uniref:phage head closure protein n=1 Tax=Paenibacillus sp. NPDC093718 TaxID=3390601 RepID=UPI003CFFB1D3